MMLSKLESGNDDTSGNTSSNQLLRDVEAISQALYLHKRPQRSLITPSVLLRQSTAKSQFSDHTPKKLKNSEDVTNKFGGSSLLEKWKKPLKALSHIRDRKFSCSFFMHVHSIEGLPGNFSDFSLCVQFQRKNEVLVTHPSRISKGMADFDETLMHRCTIYCRRNGPQNSCVYEPKIFQVLASVVGAPGIDIGKHWVDLTRLLPLTLEELGGEKSSGKWTTSFKLAGKAKGAILNVSFGFSVTTDSLLESSGNLTISQLINLANGRLDTKRRNNRLLARSGSIRCNFENSGSVPLSRYLDWNTSHEALVDPALELSQSIHFLYQKLDESNFKVVPEDVGISNLTSDLDLEHVEEIKEDEGDNLEFVVIERGIELPQKEEVDVVQGNVSPADDDSSIETVDKSEIPTGDCTAPDEVKHKHDECAKESTFEELLSAFENLLISDSTELDSFCAAGENHDIDDYMEAKSSYKSNKMVKKSLSLDDVSDSVASEFLNMLEDESDTEPESPRERLLREFEAEALVSGNFIFGLDPIGDDVGFGSDDDAEDYITSSVLNLSGQENERAIHALQYRRNVQMLEDLETKALMREWGFNEKAFQSSPRCRSSSGFGSPIEVAAEGPVEDLPMIEEILPPSA